MIKKCAFKLNLDQKMVKELSKIHKLMRRVYNQSFSILVNNFEGNQDILTLKELITEMERFTKQMNDDIKLLHRVYKENAVKFAYKRFREQLSMNEDLNPKSFNYVKLLDGFTIDNKNQKLILPTLEIPIVLKKKGDVLSFGLSIRNINGELTGSIDCSWYKKELLDHAILSKEEFEELFKYKKIYTPTHPIPKFFKMNNKIYYLLEKNDKYTLFEERNLAKKYYKKTKVLGYLKFEGLNNLRNEMEKMIEEKNFLILDKI